MSICILCEQCDKREPTPLPIGWLAVTQAKDVPSGDPFNNWHFCSFKCLQAWITRREDERMRAIR
jgi:hypothetical protein